MFRYILIFVVITDDCVQKAHCERVGLPVAQNPLHGRREVINCNDEIEA